MPPSDTLSVCFVTNIPEVKYFLLYCIDVDLIELRVCPKHPQHCQSENIFSAGLMMMLKRILLLLFLILDQFLILYHNTLQQCSYLLFVAFLLFKYLGRSVPTANIQTLQNASEYYWVVVE